jgi:hypothetical protein
MIYFHGSGKRFHSKEYACLEIAMLVQASSLHTTTVKSLACENKRRLYNIGLDLRQPSEEAPEMTKKMHAQPKVSPAP